MKIGFYIYPQGKMNKTAKSNNRDVWLSEDYGDGLNILELDNNDYLESINSNSNEFFFNPSGLINSFIDTAIDLRSSA